jgi:hypothetical protein
MFVRRKSDDKLPSCSGVCLIFVAHQFHSSATLSLHLSPELRYHTRSGHRINLPQSIHGSRLL